MKTRKELVEFLNKNYGHYCGYFKEIVDGLIKEGFVEVIDANKGKVTFTNDEMKRLKYLLRSQEPINTDSEREQDLLCCNKCGVILRNMSGKLIPMPHSYSGQSCDGVFLRWPKQEPINTDLEVLREWIDTNYNINNSITLKEIVSKIHSMIINSLMKGE